MGGKTGPGSDDGPAKREGVGRLSRKFFLWSSGADGFEYGKETVTEVDRVTWIVHPFPVVLPGTSRTGRVVVSRRTRRIGVGRLGAPPSPQGLGH